MLRSPSTDETRPILDRAKEALFSILTPRIAGSRFLDLFAGTGGVGIEALSRGAAHATFIELSPQILEDLRFNLERTRVADRAVVRHMDAFDFLKGQAAPFDVVFVAPPQWHGLWQKALISLDDTPGWVAADGVVIMQHDPKEYAKPALRHLQEFDKRRYGGVQFVFYRPGKTEAAADARLESDRHPGKRGPTS